VRIKDEGSLNAYARLGGFMYLFVLGTYIVADFLMGGFPVGGDFARASAAIQTDEPYYRTIIALQLTSSLSTIILGGAFYVLLKPIDANLALFALLWRVVETMVGGLAVVFRLMTLNLYGGAASAFGINQQAALAAMVAQGTRASFPVSTAYFSFGSTLIFYLLLKSRFIPPIFAWLGLVASVVVAFMSFATIIAPQQSSRFELLWAPIFLAEIATGVWLLVKGANFELWNSRNEFGAEQIKTGLERIQP
jgi:hypothetical protein